MTCYIVIILVTKKKNLKKACILIERLNINAS